MQGNRPLVVLKLRGNYRQVKMNSHTPDTIISIEPISLSEEAENELILNILFRDLPTNKRRKAN